MKKITFAIALALILFVAFNVAPAQVQKQQESRQPEKVVSSSNLGDQQSVENKKSDENGVQHFAVEMDVNNISSSDMKRIVFYIRPIKVVQTTAWKLYIFRAKIKSWDSKNSDRLAAHIIEGKGIPPTNIVWNGNGSNGNPLPAGKYYYILTASDPNGQFYATDCLNFKL